MTKVPSTAAKLSHAPHAATKAAAKTKKPNVHAVSGDAYGFKIGSVRTTRGFPAEIGDLPGDGIQGTFPIDKLSSIKTPGRHGMGFRLDGGAVRFLWVSARRIEESSSKKKGYEIFFWAQGKMVSTLSDRMKQAGAKESTFHFSKAEPNGKDALVHKPTQWSSDSNTALTLKKAGQWSVDMNPGEPEALRGATRIRVYGTDAEAKKALEEVQNKLGLHNVFAPSTPAAMERFKLMRLLWATDVEAARKMTMRPFSEVTSDELDQAVKNLEGDTAGKAIKAAHAAKLTGAEVKKRVRLAALLLAKDPHGFVSWCRSLYSDNGILPQKDSWDSLAPRLETAKVGPSSTAYEMALAGGPLTKEEALPVLLFGVVAKEDEAMAKALLSRDTGEIPVEDVKAALKKAGVTPDGARVKQLRFEEVYPGYFTVIDPELAKECHKAGARYLYSTYDDSERVISMLKGGQKSSLARFSEGLIIEGKSTSSDFGTGGAQAVFTRLVTASAITKAKQKNHSNYETTFNDWGGSRPFKVILNSSILGRTDWWGANSDTFGNSKDLSKDNFGEAIVKDINKDYSSSNELMFPIGNDPAYADYVVCGTDDEKAELVAAMKKAGFKEYNGKKLDAFVRVEDKFFDY